MWARGGGIPDESAWPLYRLVYQVEQVMHLPLRARAQALMEQSLL
jgi:hypothetical protein